MRQLFIAFSLIVLISCKAENSEKKSAEITSIKTVNFDQLKPLLEKKDGKTYVVNFWATWCAPCVKELPYFEKLQAEYASKNVELLLVSLDFPKQVKSKLIPFINKKNLQSEVVLLDDPNEDMWIQAIDSSWSGAIPATLIYNASRRKFYETSFDYETLENQVQFFIN